MKIWSVENATFCLMFEVKEDADVYLATAGSIANGLELIQYDVIPSMLAQQDEQRSVLLEKCGKNFLWKERGYDSVCGRNTGHHDKIGHSWYNDCWSCKGVAGDHENSCAIYPPNGSRERHN